MTKLRRRKVRLPQSRWVGNSRGESWWREEPAEPERVLTRLHNGQQNEDHRLDAHCLEEGPSNSDPWKGSSCRGQLLFPSHKRLFSLTKALIVETFEKNKNIFVSPIASFVNYTKLALQSFVHEWWSLCVPWIERELCIDLRAGYLLERVCICKWSRWVYIQVFLEG